MKFSGEKRDVLDHTVKAIFDDHHCGSGEHMKRQSEIHALVREKVESGEIESKKRDLSAAGVWEAIRIAPDMELVTGSDLYRCDEVDQVVSLDFDSGYVCTSGDVLTTAKRDILVDFIIPQSIELFQTVLKVERVEGNLFLDSYYNNLANGKCGYGISVDSNIVEGGVGVSDADYYMYFTARPAYSNIIAFAGSCNHDIINGHFGRPLAGYVNFDPAHISTTMNEFEYKAFIRVGLHEITHALGFASHLYDDYVDSDGNLYSSVLTTQTYRGLEKYLITTPNVVAAAREHFNCETLTGFEVDESSTSHWERRNVHDEYMTPIASNTMVISIFTLSLFEDMGWYMPNYELAEPLIWGYQLGCDFLDSQCTFSNAGWSGDGYFCSSSSFESCTANRMAKGRCNVRDFGVILDVNLQNIDGQPTWGGDQYSDYCTFTSGYSNTYCEDEGAYQAYSFESFTQGSRCYESTISSSRKQVCLETRCAGNNLQVRVNTEWMDCTSSQIHPITNVYVDCPLNYCSEQASLTGVPNPECYSSDDCDFEFICDLDQNICTGCSVSFPCSGDLICSSSECVECVSNTDCSNPYPVCDGANSCTICSGGDCDTKQCRVSDGACVTCLNNNDCSGATPVCDAGDGECKACHLAVNGGCGIDSCNTDTGECVDCFDSFDCSNPTAVCDTDFTCKACNGSLTCNFGLPCNSGECVECLNSTHCRNPSPICNAFSTCEECADNCPDSGICVDGSCFECLSNSDCLDTTSPVCSDGSCIPCNGGDCDLLVCDYATGECVECVQNVDCDVSLPVCSISERICRVCNDSALVNGETCDDGLDCNFGFCVECIGNAQCENPFPVCNSINECDLCDNTENFCTDGSVCDGETGVCVECLSNGDCLDEFNPVCDLSDGICKSCDSAVFGTCDGFLVCKADTGRCVECNFNADCPNDIDYVCDQDTSTCLSCTEATAGFCTPPRKYCNAENAQCEECLSNTNCTFKKTPICRSGLCSSCENDNECVSDPNLDDVCLLSTGSCAECAESNVASPTCLDPFLSVCNADLKLCRACTNDDECINPNKPNCLPNGGCSECIDNTDCQLDTLCNPYLNECTECFSDSHCSGNDKSVCNVDTGKCAYCYGFDIGCSEGLICGDTNQCEGCENDEQCGSLLCELSTNLCVECKNNDTHCDNLYSGDRPFCVNNTCDECTENTDCSDPLPFCNDDTGSCSECNQDEDCTSNSYCNLGVCSECFIDAHCTDTLKPICVFGTCGECLNDNHCDPALNTNCGGYCLIGGTVEVPECVSGLDCDSVFGVVLESCGATTCSISGASPRCRGSECLDEQICEFGICTDAVFGTYIDTDQQQEISLIDFTDNSTHFTLSMVTLIMLILF